MCFIMPGRQNDGSLHEILNYFHADDEDGDLMPYHRRIQQNEIKRENELK